MELIPIRTRVLHPPKDNLIDVLNSSLTDLTNGDVVIITSKVVSIHEGRCVPIEGTDKEKLIREEATSLFYPTWRSVPITITNNALISASGIDESNGEGYYVLLPKDAFESARMLRAHLMEQYHLTTLGVVITDSHSLPFRYGAMSIAIGCWGFEPIENHIGRTDLFGRVMQYSKTNIPDSIAAAATLVTGECDESQPIAIARGIQNLAWSENDPRPSFFIPYEDDIYRDLFTGFKKSE